MAPKVICIEYAASLLLLVDCFARFFHVRLRKHICVNIMTLALLRSLVVAVFSSAADRRCCRFLEWRETRPAVFGNA